MYHLFEHVSEILPLGITHLLLLVFIFRSSTPLLCIYMKENPDYKFFKSFLTGSLSEKWSSETVATFKDVPLTASKI